LDLACIAFFADFKHQPDEGFVYLENRGGPSAGEGGMKFSPHSVPGTECGRWITMDVADVDGDGKLDVLLANCSVGAGFMKGERDWKKGPAFLVLKNKMR
ncbi:MAG: VCBS repeat-containing protein, partial [Bacteroidetes bacterium]|nr:VCBS repeat-containing protein [Bacteroidota bacterium]